MASQWVSVLISVLSVRGIAPNLMTMVQWIPCSNVGIAWTSISSRPIISSYLFTMIVCRTVVFILLLLPACLLLVLACVHTHQPGKPSTSTTTATSSTESVDTTIELRFWMYGVVTSAVCSLGIAGNSLMLAILLGYQGANTLETTRNHYVPLWWKIAPTCLAACVNHFCVCTHLRLTFVSFMHRKREQKSIYFSIKNFYAKEKGWKEKILKTK